ncbi:MAG: sensor histidine kinase, partial [Lachnospiraceae bacterium]|nr:sensor histidine kinase [Lachnospiraceae bacterium]
MDAAFLIGQNDPPVLFLLLLFPGGILYLYWKSIMEPFLSIRKTLMGEEAEFDHQIHKLSREVFGKNLAVFIHECLELKTRKNNAEIFDKQSQLTALQTQINPHFLYNTLDTIRGMAMQHDIRDVSDVIGTLSSFFRYSISGKGSLVHIRDELKNINDYMKIQRYRFHDRFQLSIVVDEEDKRIFDFYIPRLILQPVVENAIVHGLDDV